MQKTQVLLGRYHWTALKKMQDAAILFSKALRFMRFARVWYAGENLEEINKNEKMSSVGLKRN